MRGFAPMLMAASTFVFGWQTPLPRDPAQPPTTGTGVIRGRVTAADTGAPLRRALVRANAPGLDGGRATLTDGDGRYELADLPASRYFITASKSTFVSLQYGQRRPREGGRPLTLTDKQVLENVNFQLPRGASVAGRVIDEFGEPVSDARVEILRQQVTGRQRRLVPAGRSSQTDDLGRFRVFGLEPGRYVLAAAPLNFFGGVPLADSTGFAPTYYPGTPIASLATRLTLTVGEELAEIVVALVPTRVARLSGTALSAAGKPLTRSFVQLLQADSPSSTRGGGMVQPDGSFSIERVPPGDYTLIVRSDREEGGETGVLPVTVNGVNVEHLSITTSPGVAVKGVVLSEAGTLPALPEGTRVFANPAEDEGHFGPSSAPVDQDGSFELKGVHSVVRIGVAGVPPDWMVRSMSYGNRDITDAEVEFKAGGADIVQIVLTNRITEIAGAVTDARGETLADAQVVVFSEDEDHWNPRSRRVQTARPDQYGHYRLRRVPPGRYFIVALDHLDVQSLFDPDMLRGLARDAATVTLTDGQPVVHDLRMRPQ